MGKTLSLDVDPKWHIRNVKELVAQKLELLPDEVKIIFAGKELCDSTVIEECDLGQRSVLHAVKTRERPKNLTKRSLESALEEVNEEPSRPLCETMVDLEMDPHERSNLPEDEREKSRAHFFVHCPICSDLKPGKLRVRCAICKGGAFTVHKDPECWDDVLKPGRIKGHCESLEIACVDENGDLPFAEFYFKCAEHISTGESDYAVPLNLIRLNSRKIPCLACTEIFDMVLVFPCESAHVTCIDCFKHYCNSRLRERQFINHPEFGYTLACPIGCADSCIEEIHHFKLLKKDEYDRYQRFATEEFVLQSGGVLCPQPGCGMGLLVDPSCRRITCLQGCGYVFCRNCLQGYHLGDCITDESGSNNHGLGVYTIDPNRAADARWDEASKVAIRVTTKPCPKCRTATERDGGCMHMVCTRAGCGFEWCWVCQTAWTRDCMGAHWFG